MSSMSQTKEQNPDNASAISPVERLSTMLELDMNATNATILEYMSSSVPMIPQLASYLIAAGGKRMRPLLTLASTALYEGDMSRAHTLAAAVEFIHTATLLHDDVVDKSEQRRGKDAANIVFGNEASVLVGDFLFARAFQLMTKDGCLKVLETLSNASAIITEGEVLQLSKIGQLDTSINDYIQIITSKTAALFAAACEVGPLIANTQNEAHKHLYDYGLNLGIAFQIIDDTLDYDADQTALGKNIGDDFYEGKLTAPILFALENANDEQKTFWSRTLAQNAFKDGDLETACAYIIEHDGLKKSKTLAQQYAQKAKDALSTAPDHEIKSIMIDMIDYTITRHN